MLVDKLRKLLSSEEDFYKQKSKVSWINLGDYNTKFFHNSVEAWKAKNCINGLTLKNGEITGH